VLRDRRLDGKFLAGRLEPVNTAAPPIRRTVEPGVRESRDVGAVGAAKALGQQLVERLPMTCSRRQPNACSAAN
jgi:hypothetical protein